MIGVAILLEISSEEIDIFEYEIFHSMNRAYSISLHINSSQL